MTPLTFEIRRLGRRSSVVASWAALGVVTFLASGGAEASGMVLFSPFLAAFLGALEAAEGRRAGRFDLLLSRGPRIESWVLVRWLLASLAGTTVLAAHLLPEVLSGPSRWTSIWAWLAVVVYWAALGTLLGGWVSGAAVVASMLVLMAATVWWIFGGCMLILDVLPTANPWGTLHRALVVLLVPSPPAEFDPPVLPIAGFWRILHGPLAALCLGLALLAARRWELPGRSEG